jgi:hypothetical protein
LLIDYTRFSQELKLSKVTERICDQHDAVDKIQVRTDQRPSGHWEYCEREPKFGMPPWRVQATMPSPGQIRALEGGMLNYVEIARDYVLPDPDSQEEFKELLDRCCWRPYERAGTQTFQIKTTTYTRRRRGPGGRLVRYTPKYSKITGELFAVRLEWQACGVRACRAIGLHEPADLLNFDFEAFWQKRLRLYEFDVGRLGQLLRKRDFRRIPTYKDRRVGTMLIRSVEPIGCVQDVVAKLGSRAKKALRRVALDHLIYNNVVKCPVPYPSHCNHYTPNPDQASNQTLVPTSIPTRASTPTTPAPKERPRLRLHEFHPATAFQLPSVANKSNSLDGFP